MKFYILLLVSGIISTIVNGQIIDKASGKAYKRIIIASNAPSSVRLAASDLKKYLKAVCKVDLAIKTASGEKTGNIYVGSSPELKKLGFTLKGLKSDGFKIISRNGNLYIWGRDYSGPSVSAMMMFTRKEVYNSKLKIGAFGEAGTLYGVYYFLEKFAGIRWYMPGELGTVIPAKNELRIPDIDFRYPRISATAIPCFVLLNKLPGMCSGIAVRVSEAFILFKRPILLLRF